MQNVQIYQIGLILNIIWTTNLIFISICGDKIIVAIVINIVDGLENLKFMNI